MLTDGANTYGDQGGADAASNKSTYAAYGYVGHKFAAAEPTTRLYKGTSDDVSKTSYSTSTYTQASSTSRCARFARTRRPPTYWS